MLNFALPPTQFISSQRTRFSIHAICGLVIIALLSSCSSRVKHHDGPPTFYVDETKIPNATPRYEPLAKKGNMPFYWVFGKRYYTLKSCKNFQEEGIASWYGTSFHARSTSSGEPYNMLAMTAAHKTLPLPTYVEVTNLRNNRKIIVKVNDRGPFAQNRIIDLSYVAAKKLGMLGHGTAPVKIRAIDPYGLAREVLIAKNTHPLQKSISGVHGVYLQVGAFKNIEHARKLKRRLVALLDVPVNIATPNARSSLYRVQIGPIRDTAVVKKIALQLHGLGFKPNKMYG